jgi:hypothetical protein
MIPDETLILVDWYYEIDSIKRVSVSSKVPKFITIAHDYYQW